MKPKDKSIDQEEFPGYPKYVPDEDITNQAERVDLNLEDESVIPSEEKRAEPEDAVPSDDTLETPDQFTVTQEDLEALGPKDLSLDMGDDESLKHRITPVDFSGQDLDIPGSELDDQAEAIGSEDEENNSYSLGGDNNNSLEEDPT